MTTETSTIAPNVTILAVVKLMLSELNHTENFFSKRTRFARFAPPCQPCVVGCQIGSRVDQFGRKCNKAISMMRGKSPPSELILEIIKSNNSLSF